MRAVSACTSSLGKCSQAGVISATKSVAVEHGRDGIRVNCVCPGFIQTEMTKATAERIGVPFEAFIEGAAIPDGAEDAYYTPAVSDSSASMDAQGFHELSLFGNNDFHFVIHDVQHLQKLIRSQNESWTLLVQAVRADGL